MILIQPPEFADFRALSARLGQDPLRVQGPGGNTSIKHGPAMWIKASGTELAEAERSDIFVPVDLKKVLAEACGETGNGSCKETVLDPEIGLRPSIETTFHAVLDWAVVAHTHSIAALVHAICPEGRESAKEKLVGLPMIIVPYAKPGLPLTREILSCVRQETQILILENHGLIVCGQTVAETSALIEEVEARLAMPRVNPELFVPDKPPPEGWIWADESWIALDSHAVAVAKRGTYYPDHVVFLGPAMSIIDHAGKPPAVIHEKVGVALRHEATGSQRAMLRCLSDVLLRLPREWTAEPIGPNAEAELLEWDAEKYRQALAAQQ